MPRQKLPQGEEEKGNIYQGADKPQKSGGSLKPHGKKGDDTAYQESPGKGVEYVEDIVQFPGFAKTVGGERFGHIQVIIVVQKLFKGGPLGELPLRGGFFC
jgi:hypothetical protein